MTTSNGQSPISNVQRKYDGNNPVCEEASQLVVGE
jgi:hypothetical protein